MRLLATNPLGPQKKNILRCLIVMNPPEKLKIKNRTKPLSTVP